MTIIEKLRGTTSDPVLGYLLATVDDGTIFDVSQPGPRDDAADEAFRQECREVFAYLYEMARFAWLEIDSPNEYPRPEVKGAQLFQRFDLLGGERWTDFRTAIFSVADRPDLPADYPARDFLFFMMGMLSCGWQEYIRQRWFETPKQQG